MSQSGPPYSSLNTTHHQAPESRPAHGKGNIPVNRRQRGLLLRVPQAAGAPHGNAAKPVADIDSRPPRRQSLSSHAGSTMDSPSRAAALPAHARPHSWHYKSESQPGGGRRQRGRNLAPLRHLCAAMSASPGAPRGTRAERGRSTLSVFPGPCPPSSAVDERTRRSTLARTGPSIGTAATRGAYQPGTRSSKTARIAVPTLEASPLSLVANGSAGPR